jgi:hypothetical protein
MCERSTSPAGFAGIFLFQDNLTGFSDVYRHDALLKIALGDFGECQ